MGIFICQYCSKGYDSKRGLDIHLGKNHKVLLEANLKFACKQCDSKFETLTGLCKHSSRAHKIKPAEIVLEYKYNNVQPLCNCGCGQLTGFDKGHQRFREYCKGHFSRVHNNYQYGLDKSIATRRKLSSKGLLKDSEETRKKKSEARLGDKNPNFGNRWTKEQKRVMVKNRLKTLEDNPEILKIMSKKSKTYWSTDEAKIKRRNQWLQGNDKDLLQHRHLIAKNASEVNEYGTYVYLIKVKTDNLYKIGFTRTHPNKRVLEIQTSCPYPLEVTSFYKSTLAVKLENLLHQFFAQERKIGEWFSLTSELVADFNNICQTLEAKINEAHRSENN